jgi:hypothetical protein
MQQRPPGKNELPSEELSLGIAALADADAATCDARSGLALKRGECSPPGDTNRLDDEASAVGAITAALGRADFRLRRHDARIAEIPWIGVNQALR